MRHVAMSRISLCNVFVVAFLFFLGGDRSASLVVYEQEIVIGNLIALRRDLGSFENGLETNSFKRVRKCAEYCEVDTSSAAKS